MTTSARTEGAPARLRPVEPSDLEMLFRWRNSEQIRRYMFNTSPIPWDDHCRWFERMRHSQISKFFIFEWNGTPVGTVSFSGAEQADRVANWGFYIAPEHGQSGYGSIMGFMALTVAFKELNYSTVIGEVLEFNQRSSEYHRKLGFHEHGTRQALVDGTMHNVLIFHLSAQEWELVRDSVKTHVTKGKPGLAWLS